MEFFEGLDDYGTYYQVNKVEGTVPILFIHGVGLDHSIWKAQTDYFTNQTTIIYDLICHGRSTCLLDEIHIENFAMQIDGLLQILRVNKIIIVGFSLGGLIAAHYASTRQSMIKKTILLGTIYSRSTKEQKSSAQRYQTAEKTYLNIPEQLERWFNKDYLVANPKVGEAISNILKSNNVTDFLKSYKLFSFFEDKMINFDKIISPTLIVTGEKEVGSTPEMSHNMSKIIHKSKVTIISEGKHFCNIECAKEVNKVFEKFIETKI